MWGISWLNEEMSASEEGLCLVQLVVWVYREGILEKLECDCLFIYVCEMWRKINVACVLNLAICCKRRVEVGLLTFLTLSLDREEWLVPGKTPVHTGYEYVQFTDLVWTVVRRKKSLPARNRNLIVQAKAWSLFWLSYPGLLLYLLLLFSPCAFRKSDLI